MDGKKVVICGGGIIGSSIAYHLALRGVTAQVIERCAVACAASGKAGGFLARDWCEGSPVGPLARKSFDMHAELAETLGVDCNYRRLDTLSVAARENRVTRAASAPDWMDGNVAQARKMGTPEDTAQVHPGKLTRAFMDAALARGATLRIGVVQGIEKETHGKKEIVRGVIVDGEVVPADVVVIAMGPWTINACKWLKIPEVHGQRAHSILMHPSAAVGAHAIFLEYKDAEHDVFDPEIYPRSDGEVYVCGMTDTVPLPDDPSEIHPNPASGAKLKEIAGKVSSALAETALDHVQACYVPHSADGVPIIGAVEGVEGAYVAAGHSVWGILNAPITGAAMAELIVEGECKIVDLRPFSPSRRPY